MSKSLYPTALFHFTKEKSVFESIIKEKQFRVSYARERIIGPETIRDFAIPMVSFCDIRLSQIEQHTKSYGEFGVGLSKDWAERNNLNPVIYMSKGCDVFDAFNQQLRVFMDGFGIKSVDKEKGLKTLTDEYKNISNVIRYMKNYSGPLKRRNQALIKNYIYADEREWRYIPSSGKTNGAPFMAAYNNLNTEDKKKKYNDWLGGISLPFDFDDVRYFIVDKQENIDSLIDILDSMGMDKKQYSKIMCATQIIDDL
ncbi:abortive infection system antitoxin AbiGi family protein [Pectobacterium sp. CHL-2024]|uniref:abortive infection system antitoxin AbiGi family protein n=1 Tax=Pectobacterium sp. CHL-2024 TaxID=3377079 RepID=UPI00381D2EB3